jgi:hypothetical protein
LWGKIIITFDEQFYPLKVLKVINQFLSISFEDAFGGFVKIRERRFSPLEGNSHSQKNGARRAVVFLGKMN